MDKKVVAIIPIKTNNTRLPGKNTKPLNGQPLYHYMFETVKKCSEIDEVYVDSSDDHILMAAKSYGLKTIKRPEELNSDSTNGNDLLVFEAEKIDADIYVQLFVTSPFLKSETIDYSIRFLKSSGKHDSILPMVEIHHRFWERKVSHSGIVFKEVNHNSDFLKRTQDLPPVYCEADFYVVRRVALMRRNNRIGEFPYVVIVDTIEATDIDTKADFLYARSLIDAGLV